MHDSGKVGLLPGLSSEQTMRSRQRRQSRAEVVGKARHVTLRAAQPLHRGRGVLDPMVQLPNQQCATPLYPYPLDRVAQDAGKDTTLVNL